MGAYAVTGLLLCFAVPLIAGMGVAGSVADRFDPRTVLVAGGLAQALAAAALAGVGSLGGTFALVLVMQAAFAVTNPLWAALVPEIVGRELVGTTVSSQHGLRGVATPIGAALGGALVEHGGAAVALLANASALGVLALVPLLLRTRLASGPSAAAEEEAPLAWLIPRAGWAALGATPGMRVLVLALLPFIVTLETGNVVEVFLVRDILGGSAEAFGLVSAMGGVGAVVGSLGAALLRSFAARRRGILAALAVCALAQLAGGLAPTWAAFAAVAGVMGVGAAVVNALIFAVLLTETAADLRARTLALVNGLARAMTVLALAAGGVAGSTLGPRMAFIALGGAGLAVALAATVAVTHPRRAT